MKVPATDFDSTFFYNFQAMKAAAGSSPEFVAFLFCERGLMSIWRLAALLAGVVFLWAAEPSPKPPAMLFNGPIPLEVSIVFELM